VEIMKVLRRAIVLTCVAICSLANGLSAQTLTLPTQRPDRSLFGRARNGDGLDVTVATFKGYDDDQSAEGLNGLRGASRDAQEAASGQFDGLDIAIMFAKKTQQVTFGIGEHSDVRYYPGLDHLVGIQHSVAGGLTAAVGHTQINVSQTLAYAPFYSFSTLPVLFEAQPGDVAPSPNQVLTERPSLTLTTSANVTHTMGRASLSFVGSTQRTDFTEEAVTALRADALMGRFFYHLSRDLGLVAAYGLQRGRYSFDANFTQAYDFRNIQLGLDYDRPLSRSRRTKIGFTTGMTQVGHSGLGDSGYRLVGDGRISREIGRTWLATASYRRSVGLIAGFPQPMFSDGLALSVTGSATQRLVISASGGFSNGEMTDVTIPNHNENYSASLQMQLALTRMLALNGGLGFYRYRFDNTVGLPVGIQPAFDRRSARIGLSVWLPVYR
jgi:hypothetical protein